MLKHPTDTVSHASTRSSKPGNFENTTLDRVTRNCTIRQPTEVTSHVLGAQRRRSVEQWSDEVSHMDNDAIADYLANYKSFKLALDDVLKKGSSKKLSSEALDPTVREVATWLARKWRASRAKFSLPESWEEYMGETEALNAHVPVPSRQHDYRLADDAADGATPTGNEQLEGIQDPEAKRIIEKAESAIRKLSYPETLYDATRVATARRHREITSRRPTHVEKEKVDRQQLPTNHDASHQRQLSQRERFPSPSGADGKEDSLVTKKNNEGSSMTEEHEHPQERPTSADLPAAKENAIESHRRTASRMSAIEDMLTAPESQHAESDDETAAMTKKYSFTRLKQQVVSPQVHPQRGRRNSTEVLQKALKSLENPHDATF
eukprot:gb/GECG01002682.1/.p1 GENE.gb/GECG01002682.1/~~gb/GECG01002682.1/.p1  ORF type:complete len:378 (+),score=57.57 gb/GECG01002682.1/:1-1134(+)